MTGEVDIKSENQPGQQGGPQQGESNGPNSEPKVFDSRRGRGGRFPNMRRPDGRNDDGNDQQNRGPGHRGGFMGRGRGGGGRGGGNRSDSLVLGGAGRGGDGTFFLNERLLKTINGPTVDIPTAEYKEKKFNGRCRLYVGNLPQDITEDEFNNMFAPYGATSELYINKEKNFAFIRLDYRSTAEKAKRELDGFSIRNRNLRVRFAPLGSTIKVKNLTNYVTNELLELGFSVFGEIERAMVCVDERGNSLKEGIIEFTRKGSALSALRYCADGCFFLTSSLKPVIVEAFEPSEDNDGYSEKMITKKTPDYYQAREVGPRFAKQGSFEYEFGKRWKQMHELFKQKEESLRRELKHEEEKLEAQLQYAKYEHETELLREQLRQREMDRERQKREWEMKERQAEEQRVAEEEALRRQQEDLSRRMLHQEDELRRRQQENSLFMQTHQLNNLMEQPESAARSGGGGSGGYANNSSLPGEAHEYPVEGGPRPMEANYMDYNRGGNRFEGSRGEGARMDEMGTRRPAPAGGRWSHQERRGQPEDFPNKRRRF